MVKYDCCFKIQYDELGQRKLAKCKYCKNFTLTEKRSSNYGRHVRDFHKDLYARINKGINNKKRKRAKGDVDKKNTSESESESDCDDSLDPLKFQTALVKLLANHGIAHSIVDDPLFSECLSVFKEIDLPISEIIPTRQAHRVNVLRIGDETFENSLLDISSSGGTSSVVKFVSLAVDGWTNQAFAGKYTTTIAICGGKSKFLWTDLNCSSDDSSDSYLFPLLSHQIKFLLSHNIIICALITDGASNFRKLGNSLVKIEKVGPVIIHVTCAAHVLQLLIEDISNIPPIKSILDKFEAILVLFSSSKDLRLQLRSQQLKYPISESKEPYRLVLLNKTRWLSRYKSIERLLLLKDIIRSIFSSSRVENEFHFVVSDSWWDDLAKLVFPVIKLFAFATEIAESDRATLLDLNDIIINIMKQLPNLISKFDVTRARGDPSPPIERPSKTSSNLIKFRFSIYCGKSLYLEAIAMLTDSLQQLFPCTSYIVNSDSSPFSNVLEKGACIRRFSQVEDWIVQWGTALIMCYGNFISNIDSSNEVHVNQRIKMQLAAFQDGVDGFETKISTLKTTTREVPNLSFKYNKDKIEYDTDWKSFWRKYYRNPETAELSITAFCLLHIGISEAVCERSFSLQKSTHSFARNRLANTVVEAEMRIRCSHLANAPNEKSTVFELEDD